MIHAGFPVGGDDASFLALIQIAMYGAANAIESHVRKNNFDIRNFETTLAMALYDGKNVYYGNAGDSGVVALDEYGEYHVLSQKQNNEFDEVCTLRARNFEVGKADFQAAAVFCMTDGLLDWVVPEKLSNWKFPVHVNRANLFVNPSFWDPKTRHKEMTEYKDIIVSGLSELVKLVDVEPIHEEFGSLKDGNLKDDLSAAVLINTSACLSPEEIRWEAPPEPTKDELYEKEWQRLKKLYPDVARQKFIKFISVNNPSMKENDIFEYAATFWDSENIDVPSEDELTESAFKTKNETLSLQDTTDQEKDTTNRMKKSALNSESQEPPAEKSYYSKKRSTFLNGLKNFVLGADEAEEEE